MSQAAIPGFGHPGCRQFLRPVGLRDTGLPALISAATRHGSTDSFEVWYDDALGQRGQAVAEVMLSRCENDLAMISALFQGVRPATLPIRVMLARMPAGAPAYHDRCDPSVLYCDVDTVGGGGAQRVLYSCFLLATQLVEVVAAAQGNDWQGDTAHGEALSRTIAATMYPRWLAEFSTAGSWSVGLRSDAINQSIKDDSDDEAIGCSTLFLNYLHHELGFGWRQIIAAGAPTLAVCYQRLTGQLADPFPAFERLVAGQQFGDNPFPVTQDAHSAPIEVSQASGSAGPASGATQVLEPVRQIEQPSSQLSLQDALAHRRWWRIDTPFRHVRAEGVFVPEVYEALVRTFRMRKERGDLTRSLPGYDASGAAVTPANADAFGIFLSRQWHDLVAGLFGMRASGDVIATLHHHAPGSASGQAHNDLNPGWFPVPAQGGPAIRVHDPAVSNYRSGHSPSGIETVERIRGISLLYYLDTPEDVRGGGTGLYRTPSQRVEEPDIMVPPRNNSLIAFECTPFSFHSFVQNLDRERNCIVMWLHREKSEVEAQWGPGSIIGWK